MPSLIDLVPFALAAAAVVAVPGPTVSIIVANAMRHGTAAGLANVAGTQFGLLLMTVILAIGLDAVVQLLGEAFVVLKLIGAAYLVYLGIKLFRSDGRIATAAASARSLPGFAVQGFLVIWSNPKALLFFGAFIPPFVSAEAPAAPQVIAYGVTFMVVATLLDGLYAVAAGSMGRLLTRGRVRTAEMVGGGALIGGGVALAFARR